MPIGSVPPPEEDLSPQLRSDCRRFFDNTPARPAQEGRHNMRKTELDHMLELAVARALGVKLPHMRTAARPARKNATARRPMRHAA